MDGRSVCLLFVSLVLGLLFAGCGPNGLNVKASDFVLKGSISCTGEAELVYKDSVSIGLEGKAAVGGETSDEGQWGACEQLALTFSEAKWRFLSLDQGRLECKERAGEAVFEAPPEEVSKAGP